MEVVQGAPDRAPTVGIIGAGHIGQAFARVVRRAGRGVVLANSRGPESLTDLVAAFGAGISAGTIGEAAKCPLVVIAVPWSSVPFALEGVDWGAQIVVDATNALLFPDLRPADLGGRTSSEIVAELVGGAPLVKAGNTLPAEVLGADPHEAGGRRVIFMSGDDAGAKTSVAGLFEAAGFWPIDLGDLATGGRMQQAPGGALAGHNFVRIP
jgi:8-hydroxy-5-deazaflavin:NADPH oxidoreductase